MDVGRCSEVGVGMVLRDRIRYNELSTYVVSTFQSVQRLGRSLGNYTQVGGKSSAKYAAPFPWLTLLHPVRVCFPREDPLPLTGFTCVQLGGAFPDKILF